MRACVHAPQVHYDINCHTPVDKAWHLSMNEDLRQRLPTTFAYLPVISQCARLVGPRRSGKFGRRTTVGAKDQYRCRSDSFVSMLLYVHKDRADH